MAQIGTADVTYSHVTGSSYAAPSMPMRSALYNITFGDGTLTYTNGGIPLLKGKLGCPGTLQQFIMTDSASSVGYVAKFDKTALSIRLYVSTNTTAAGPTALVEVNTATAVTATTLQALVSGW
jgi:hypothetical protein